jgi:hypothetical protein
MAFVERVMHWGSQAQDTEPPTFEPDTRELAVHAVYAASIEMALGRITVAQFKTAISATAADNVDIDALVAAIPAAAAARAVYVHGIHSILILAEGRWPGYNTPAQVRTKLGI